MVLENDFLLVYASQTGQAEAIAEEFYLEALNSGLSPRLHCITEHEKEFYLEREICAVFIVSTTGEGEPPEKAVKFWRKIKRSVLPADHFSHLNFTVLGLGDTNYTNFCNFGRMLNSRLKELGARHFSESMWADDGVGLEVVVEPWKEETLNNLKKHLGKDKEIGTTVDENTQQVSAQIPTSVISQTITVELSQDLENSCSISSSKTVVNCDKEEGKMKILETEASDCHNQSSVLTSGVQLDVPKKESDFSDTRLSNETFTPVSQSDTLTNDASSEIGGDQQLVHSLTHSLMSELPLTLPLCPPRFLRVNFLPDGKNSESGNPTTCAIQNGFPFPGARSSVSQVPVVSAKRLTHHSAVKTTLQIDLDIGKCDWSYEPGDTIAVICPNDVTEVNRLLELLNLTEVSYKLCYIDLLPNSKKKNARVPEFFLQYSTISEILRTCCEIRESPRKVFLRALVDFTENPSEKRRLQELCSKQGSDDFAKFIRQPNLSLLDILIAFPSCKPPIEVILENLSRLQPRAYSVASSLLTTPGHLQFVFNVLHFESGEGQSGGRDGVCTGWLNKITRRLQTEQLQQNNSCEHTEDSNSINDLLQLDIFLRTNHFFHLPADLSIPLVMIGPGTGVSPFIGFLHHRSKMISTVPASASVGITWLFYGCRNKNLDFLFREELEAFVSDGILSKLLVSYSRDLPLSENSPRYVQDNMKLFGEELVALICDQNAQVYICGDAKGMSPGVYKIFKELLTMYRGMDEMSAEGFMNEMRVQKRYLEDVWV